MLQPTANGRPSQLHNSGGRRPPKRGSVGGSARVTGFLSDLADLASELDLVEIYLQGDLEAGIERATAREGSGWIDGQIAKVSTFGQLASPPRSASDLAAYYGVTADWAAGFRDVIRWPVKLCSAEYGPQSVLACALEFLGQARSEVWRGPSSRWPWSGLARRSGAAMGPSGTLALRHGRG